MCFEEPWAQIEHVLRSSSPSAAPLDQFEPEKESSPWVTVWASMLGVRSRVNGSSRYPLPCLRAIAKGLFPSDFFQIPSQATGG